MIFLSRGILVWIISDTQPSCLITAFSEGSGTSRKPAFPQIVIGPAFKIGAWGDRALWPDDVWGLRFLSRHLAQRPSQLIHGLGKPGWSVMKKWNPAGACPAQRNIGSSAADKKAQEGCREPYCFLKASFLLLLPWEGQMGGSQSHPGSFSVGQRTSS